MLVKGPRYLHSRSQEPSYHEALLSLSGGFGLAIAISVSEELLFPLCGHQLFSNVESAGTVLDTCPPTNGLEELITDGVCAQVSHCRLHRWRRRCCDATAPGVCGHGAPWLRNQLFSIYCAL